MARTRGGFAPPRRTNPPRNANQPPEHDSTNATPPNNEIPHVYPVDRSTPTRFSPRKHSRRDPVVSQKATTKRNPATPKKNPATPKGKKQTPKRNKANPKRKQPSTSAEQPRGSPKRRREEPSPPHYPYVYSYIPPILELEGPPAVGENQPVGDENPVGEEHQPVEEHPIDEAEPVGDENLVGEAEHVVPEADRSDFDGFGEDFDDRVVPPNVEEEVCDDFTEHFGVNEGVELGFNENEMPNDNAEDVVLSGSESEYDVHDDEKIPEPISSDESDDEEEPARNNEDEGVNENENADMLKLGKCFPTAQDFKNAILKYSLRSRYDIKLYRSQARRIGAKCNDKEGQCEWKCYASYENKKQQMQVKVFVDVHTCVRSGYTRLLRQGTVAWLFEDRLRLNPKMTKTEMAEEVNREYNLVVSEEICAKAKTILARKRKQSHEAHFSRVWDYQAEIWQSNPGSTLEIETVPGPTIGSKQRFLRLYMCFKAQRDLWKQTCRPIIGLDGAFLKWDIKGHLLAAVGRDGDNRIVPIAWAVVEIESDDNWDWFVQHLSTNLGLGDGRNYAIISDKQKVVVSNC